MAFIARWGRGVGNKDRCCSSSDGSSSRSVRSRCYCHCFFTTLLQCSYPYLASAVPENLAWPGGTKHTKRRKCPLLGKSRVPPTTAACAPRHAATAASGTNLCAAAALNLRAHRHFVPYRLCLLERSRVGRINLSTTTSTLLGWHGSRASVVVLWLITSATFYGEIANGLDSIWQAGR